MSERKALATVPFAARPPLSACPLGNETVVPGQTVSPADVQIVSIQHPQRPVLWMKLYHAKVYGNIHGARGGGRLLR